MTEQDCKAFGLMQLMSENSLMRMALVAVVEAAKHNDPELCKTIAFRALENVKSLDDEIGRIIGYPEKAEENKNESKTADKVD